MKKSVLLGIAALALATTGNAVAQEVQYVPDCSQGLLINQNKNNWFITLEGGANALFGQDDNKVELKDRISGNAALYIGKWVTPTFGFRFGANWVLTKGATTENGTFRNWDKKPLKNGYYDQTWMGIGPEFDVLINLTNWWCGYRPGRVYNAVLHGGAGAYYRMKYAGKNKADYTKDIAWRNADDIVMFMNIGLQNNFRLSKHVDFFIDLQYELVDDPIMESLPEVFLGFNFNLGKTDWNCPVTAVCPTWKYTDAEGDALVAKLANAENKIASLQQQLDACLKRPVEKAETKEIVKPCDNLATIYYPIAQYGLSTREKKVLKSVAEVMVANPDQKYVLTGWADNYTGNDEINTRLRQQRVDTVKNYLVSCGVNADQLEATIDNSNLTDFGEKGAPLDRAVTIQLR